MPTPCRFFSSAEYKAREAERQAAVAAYRKEHLITDQWPAELIALNAAFFPPGSMWLCHWYHDPEDPMERSLVPTILKRIEEDPEAPHMLSIHYWRDWALIRPPLMVICPGGGHWCPDQKSSNGDGWTVTGEAPAITAHPSIWVNQGRGAPREYHGWLKDGVFSDGA